MRFFVSALAALLIAAMSVVAWQALREHETSQVARIAESESYAARSRLIRDIDTLLQTLRNVRGYWSAFDRLPRAWWVEEAETELNDFAGVEALLWYDSSSDTRFLRNAAHPGFDYQPTDREWNAYDAAVNRARAYDREAMLGPDATGSAHQVQIIIPDRRDTGRLIAVIDAQRMLEGLLTDSSPGYMISVSWDDTELFARGEPGQSQLPAWQREGLIRNSMGVIWRVVHAPGEALAESMQAPAIEAVTAAGIVIAVLVGLLILENGRAQNRAATAERVKRQLAELNVDLERQIAERTRELKDRSNDLLTIADSVGHDLRNPLNSISTNTQLLELKYASAIGEDGLSTIRQTTRSIHRMTEILDRLLGLSALSNATFRRERLDIARLVRDQFEELQSTEPGAPVELVIGELPAANADPTLTRTLLMNLIGNALKYSRDKQERRIEVGSVLQQGVPEYFVKDSGVGFDGDAAERLFEAFERLTDDKSRDGLGLGLHIAARVVRRHGGRIRAEGRPGEGATFHFTLQPPNDTPLYATA